jgi:hypothetical protein
VAWARFSAWCCLGSGRPGRPRLVRPGDSEDYFTHEQLDTWDLAEDLSNETNDPRTPYYRLDGGAPRQIEPGQVLFEFLVPMTAPARLSPDTIASYTTALGEGITATAVALSVLDTAAPWNRRTAVQAWRGWAVITWSGGREERLWVRRSKAP